MATILFKPQCVNSLKPSDHHQVTPICLHIIWSALVQVMAWCLMAPSHYLNQCWQIISDILWHSHEGNFPYTYHQYVCISKWLNLRIQRHLPGISELNTTQSVTEANTEIHHEPDTDYPINYAKGFPPQGNYSCEQSDCRIPSHYRHIHSNHWPLITKHNYEMKMVYR